MEVDSRPTLKSIGSMHAMDQINTAMTQVFQEAQFSLSGHRKLVVILTNLHNKAIELGYEEAFSFKFTKLINKILPLKKGEESGDRIIKFCSVFIANLFKNQQNDDSMEIDDTTRIANYLLNHLLRGVEAKDRNVRYRIIQLIAYLVNFIGDIDATVFTSLVHSLRKRLSDKEPTVRLQAVVALSRFQHIEDEDYESQNEGDENVSFFSRLLIEVMQNDDSPEVRRAALLNMVKNKYTLPHLIERARDVNTINRRIVYSRILKEFGDFREIDLESRTILIQWGLNDREPSVKNAAIKLFNNNWLETVNRDFLQLLDNLYLYDNDDSINKLIQHLFELNLDIVKGLKFDKSYWKEFSVEKSFLLRNLYEFLTRNKYYNLIDEKFVDLIELSDILYKYLKLRKVRLSKNKDLIDSYNEFKRAIETKDSDLHSINSEIEYLFGKLQQYEHEQQEDQNADHDIISNRKNIIEKLSVKIQDLESKQNQVKEEKQLLIESNQGVNEEYNDFKEEYSELEFIIENLLKISKDYDYADEAGRRSMLQIIRTSLTNENLSDKLTEITLKVLKILSINERDFIGMTTEIITDIRDSVLDENDETFLSAHSGFMGDSDSEEEEEEEEHEPPESQSQENEEVNPDYTNNLNRIENVFDDQNFNKSYTKSKSGSKRRKLQPKTPPRDILNQCLCLTQHLLELTNEPMSNNYSLGSILQSLVYPAVLLEDGSMTNKLGIKCLGLFLLLDKELAIEKLYFFGRVVSLSKFDEEVRIIATKVIIDVLSTYGTSVFDVGTNELTGNEEYDFAATRYVDSLSLNKLFIKSLKNYKMGNLQAVTAEGLCKLYLADILENFGDNIFETPEEKEQEFEDLLEVLVLSYFDAKNYFNNKLRQALSFCIPVYAFSHAKHQVKIGKITGNIIYKFSKRQQVYEDYYRDNDAALNILHGMSTGNVIQQLIHWCDPNNLVKKEDPTVFTPESTIWQIISLLQAIEQDTSKSVKKSIINNFNKIYLTEQMNHKMLISLGEAIEETIKVIELRQEDSDFALDVLTSRNMTKFHEIIKDLIEKSSNQQKEQLPIDAHDVSNHSYTQEHSNDVSNHSHTQENSPDPETPNQEHSEPKSVNDQQQELNEIDQFLEAEDQVEYLV